MCGDTASPNFPTTAGAYQTLNSEETDGYSTCFITKLNALGTGLVFSTFLGGSGNVSAGFGEFAAAVALDPSDSVTVTGSVASTDFPTTAGAYLTADPNPQASCEFVTKLNPSGTSLIFSTYFDGGEVNGLALDASGDPIFVGATGNSGFPTTSDAFLAVYPAPSQQAATVSEISGDGTKLLYSSFLGGNNTGGDNAYGDAVNSAGNPVIVGVTTSQNFPVTAGALQGAQPGTSAAFVTTLLLSPFSSFTITPDSVVGGGTCTGSITLASAASTNTLVALSSSSFAVTVPPSVEIAAGGVSNTFNVGTLDVTGEVYITATLGSASQTIGLNLVASALAGVTANPGSVVGGNSATGLGAA